jgi:hypothetical protein
MGNTYTNITLYGPGADDVRQALSRLKYSAYVSRTVQDITVVCDRRADLLDLEDQDDIEGSGHGEEGHSQEDWTSPSDSDDDDGLNASADHEDADWDALDARWATVAQELSTRLRCVAWAVRVYDDDILQYKLFDAGTERDEYLSTPDYFDGEGGIGALFTFLIVPRLPLPRFIRRWLFKRAMPRFKPPKGGDAAMLCRMLGRPEAQREVEAILRKPKSGGESMLGVLMDPEQASRSEDERGDVSQLPINPDDFLFEIWRHQALVRALSLPDFAPGAGYRYVAEGDVNNPDEWVLVGV